MEKTKLNFKVEKFTELTDAQWAIIQKLVDTGRKIQKDLRQVVNCILKITRTGTQWTNMVLGRATITTSENGQKMVFLGTFWLN